MKQQSKPLCVVIIGYLMILIAVGILVLDFVFPNLAAWYLLPASVVHDGKILSTQQMQLTLHLTRTLPMVCLLVGLILLLIAKKINKRKCIP